MRGCGSGLSKLVHSVWETGDIMPDWAAARCTIKACEDALVRTLSRRHNAVKMFIDILNDE